MNNPLQETKPDEVQGLIGPLAWFTLIYFFSFIGYLGASQGGYWYISQRRPDWGPPLWVFTAIWTVLYGLIAVASWQVRKSEPTALRIFCLVTLGIQLVLGASWPWLLFANGKLLSGFILAAVLTVVAMVTVVVFWKVKPSAGGLMLPQVIWTMFTTLLNFALWQLNK